MVLHQATSQVGLASDCGLDAGWFPCWCSGAGHVVLMASGRSRNMKTREKRFLEYCTVSTTQSKDSS